MAVTFGQPAWASYSLDGANDRLTGTFTTQYDLPFTMACWVKATHSAEFDTAFSVGPDTATQAGSIQLGSNMAADVWAARPAGVSGDAATETIDIDGVWTPLVGVFTSSTLRDVYVGAIANTGQNTNSEAGADFDNIIIGENLANSADFAGLVAECAVWDRALDSTEIEDYLGGVPASSVAASDLVGYWPLDADNSTQANEGVDATGDLTVANAVFNADHPTLSGGGAPTFSSPPALDDCDSDSCIFDFTPSGSADLHWAAYTTGASAPADCAAVDAASGAEEAGEEAVTGADSVDIPSVMVQQDYYFCLENGSGTSAVASVLNQNRDARTGYEITTLTSVAVTSIFDLDAYYDPDVALDIVESEADTNENAGCLVNFEVDGDFVLVPSVAGDCDGRPTFEYCIQDTSDSTGEFTTPACWTGGDDTVYVNNTPPTLIEGEFASLLIEVDVAMTPIALATRWEDVDGDAVTVTFQDSLPSGLTNNAGSLEGTPNTLQVFTEITERATDAAGDFTEVEIEIAIGVRLPDVTAWLLDESLWNTTSIFGVNDDYFSAPRVVGW